MADKKQPAKMKLQSMSELVAVDLLAWILICGLITGVFFLIDNQGAPGQLVWNPETWRFEREPNITWAPGASLWVGLIGLSVATAHIIYHHAKRHGRNAVAWATAFIVFSPFLSFIVYLITWPTLKTEKNVFGNHARAASTSQLREHGRIRLCESCGNTVKENDIYCPHCGLELKASPHVNTCPKCGWETDAAHKFCPKCGTDLKQSQQ